MSPHAPDTTNPSLAQSRPARCYSCYDNHDINNNDNPACPAKDGRDHLSALPAELLHHIISYLFPSHFPEKVFHHAHADADADAHPLAHHSCPRCARPTKKNNHDLDYLSATCKTLRSEVNDWSRSWLKQHAALTKFHEGRIWPKPTTKRNGVVQMRKNFTPNYLRGKNGALLNWIQTNCVFCGKKSQKSAIMMNGLRCCMPCDKKEWADKITMSQAMQEFGLQKHQLLPSREASSPQLAKMLKAHPALPTLWYGTYYASNVQTTIFMRHDVKRLAELVFGNLDAHLAKREEQRRRWKKSREEGKKRKMMEEQGAQARMREAQLNAAPPAMLRPDMAENGQQQIAAQQHSRTKAGPVIDILDDEADQLHELNRFAYENYPNDPIVID